MLLCLVVFLSTKPSRVFPISIHGTSYLVIRTVCPSTPRVLAYGSQKADAVLEALLPKRFDEKILKRQFKKVSDAASTSLVLAACYCTSQAFYDAVLNAVYSPRSLHRSFTLT